MSKGLEPAAAAAMKHLANIAHDIGIDWQNNNIKAIIPPWQRAADLLGKMPAKLNAPEYRNARLVLKYLMTPWVKEHLKLLKAGKGDRKQVNDYYLAKNAVLDALAEISGADQQAP